MKPPGSAPSTAELALSCSSTIRSIGIDNLHTLISCSKSKGGHRDAARNMYVSPLYRKSVMLTERWGIPFSILSAKYGLLDPDQIIEPYELTLKGAPKQVKVEWARLVDAQIRSLTNKNLIILAGDDYFSPLVEVGESDPLKYFAPMRGLSLGTRLSFLNEAIRIERRRDAVATAYDLFGQFSDSRGFSRLRDILADELPSHGVYFFFDDSEPTAFSHTLPRLVRVGTHGVSLGSVATLRNRLRTHFGTRAGTGNHRASVFRLHVGRAIIEREGLQMTFPHWGKGQSATREITDGEVAMEKRVSEYIGNLRVLFIPVHDAAGTGSMRAVIEQQFIAMFTEHFCAIESSSPDWLGRFSDKSSIKETGLWNVRDVGREYDLKFLPYLGSFLSRAAAS
jgi:hypothetical protein